MSTRMPDAVGPTKLPKKKLEDHIPRRRRAFNNDKTQVGSSHFYDNIEVRVDGVFKFFASSGIQTGVIRWLQSVERLHVTLDPLATTAGQSPIYFYTNLTSQELD